MKRQLDPVEMEKWKVSVGGWKKAADLIREKLNCSDSKAEKLVQCTYNCALSFAEQMSLVELMKRPHDRLFRLAATKGKKRAS